MNTIAMAAVGTALTGAVAMVAAYALWLARAPFPAGPRPSGDREWPALEVIVATFNERPLIQGKLENLSRLTYPSGRLRFVIVDGGSTDGSYETAESWSRNDARFLVLAAGRPGKAAQLNLGLRHAVASWIVVTDVDARMNADALQILMGAAGDNPALSLIGCPVMPVNVHPAEQMYWRMLNWLRVREWCRGSASMVMAPCYAFKRALIDRFPEDVVSDDVHVAWRVGCLGHAIGLAGSVVQEVRGPQTGAGLFRQKVRRGAGMLREMFRFVPAAGGMPPPLRAAFAIRLALFLLGPVLAIATVAWALAVLTSLPAVDAGAAVALAACTAGLLVWPREGSRVRRPLALLALLTASTTASLLLYPIFGPTGSFSLRTGRAASQKPVSGL